MYGGRGDEPNSLFISGKCAMITGSSGLRANIMKNAKFEFGTSTVPYYADVKGAPQNTIIGGASLWVFANKKPEVYKGVTKFFKFLASPEIAARWHQQTGYVPVTVAAYELTQKQGFYDKNPAPTWASSSSTSRPPRNRAACAWATCRRSAKSRMPRSSVSSRARPRPRTACRPSSSVAMICSRSSRRA